MAALRAGLAIRGLNPAETLAAIVRAEERGLRMVWSTVGGTNPDAVTLFAAAVAKTNTIGVGTAIVPTYPRHPIALASQALVLGALAPGRFRLGIGPSHRPTIEGMFGIQMGKPGDKSEMRFYNGHTALDISDAYGLKKLGIEKLKPIFTRAHLIDMVALKGGMMDAGQEITSADIKAALAKQNIPESDIKPGDAIMFHTGWGSLWMKNNDRFNSGEPGIGLDAAKWVVEWKAN